ncbi:hypothetical protein C8R44DRAFT_894201 [Mycena epipterygia]|nr:hypothetical protein C8R44DRAFT_894201 [Mycena epipterygia]
MPFLKPPLPKVQPVGHRQVTAIAHSEMYVLLDVYLISLCQELTYRLSLRALDVGPPGPQSTHPNSTDTRARGSPALPPPSPPAFDASSAPPSPPPSRSYAVFDRESILTSVLPPASAPLSSPHLSKPVLGDASSCAPTQSRAPTTNAACAIGARGAADPFAQLQPSHSMWIQDFAGGKMNPLRDTAGRSRTDI